jgi:hypothetical protein
VRHHDRYENSAAVDKTAEYQVPTTSASCCG